MERQFNEQQQRVIRATGGHHLVLAPPGCGKTAVLAERILYAHQQGVAFKDMACLTFTNRASRGMKERIDSLMGARGAAAEPLSAENIADLFVGNVHRFCSQFLFDNKVVAENTAIIDTDVSISIIADFLNEDELKILADTKQRQGYSQVINLQHLMYQCRKRYPGNLMVHRDALKPVVLKELCQVFGLPYTHNASIWLYENIDDYIATSAFMSGEAMSTLKALYGARHYELYKLENDLIDFEDLLLLTYESMAPQPPKGELNTALGSNQTPPSGVRGALPLKKWIQVDEVQDLNPLQLAIIDLFTAPDATVVYLGDPQQAIFSFMGAKLNTLDMLRQRCGAGHLYNFFVNYRSPRYLLDLYNSYGQQQLGIAPELLPQTQDETPRPQDGLQIIDSYTNVDEANDVARLVTNLYHDHPDETTAVVVAFNSDADAVSAALRLPHFKISGTDVFSTPEMRLLIAHFNVIVQESNFIAWSRLFTGLKLFGNHSEARKFTHALMELGITPTDFLSPQVPASSCGTTVPPVGGDGESSPTYLQSFMLDYEQHEFVIFDTETTGLNVFEDDIVQIAAVKVRNGKPVEELNLFLETSRPIPPMLGDTPNPLVEEYARRPHLPPAEALRAFVRFAQDAAILGHNATYDYQIMRHNMLRHCPELDIHALWPSYYDTLKLMRLVSPRMKSYKLKDILTALDLKGQNSHLANDDIMATLSVANHCWQRACELAPAQTAFLKKRQQTILRFRNLYGELYHHSRALLYEQVPASDLATEMQYIYRELLHHRRMAEIPKMQYILNYIAMDMTAPILHPTLTGGVSAAIPPSFGGEGGGLITQLEAHLQELNTLKEADLCGSVSMQERVFVSTVHKAKGLEFDNVIVFDAVEGKFPSYYADSNDSQEEEARKFYVAISRAKKRLFIALSQQHVSPWGRLFERQPSPFLRTIRDFFP